MKLPKNLILKQKKHKRVVKYKKRHTDEGEEIKKGEEYFEWVLRNPKGKFEFFMIKRQNGYKPRKSHIEVEK